MLDAAGALAGEMIAGQSELEGLRRIYTDNNSRVKSLSARVAELRKELEKLGGTQANGVNADASLTAHAADPQAAQAGGMPYPTIKSLPLLGAKYADYYRLAKIQETVYELLTEQYELAKVQEVKETPSVKVLDPARVPERKSSPPRLLIVFLGTFFAASVCLVWVVGSSHWHQADADDPRKILALEVAAALKARAPWGSRNGDDAVSGLSGKRQDCRVSNEAGNEGVCERLCGGDQPGAEPEEHDESAQPCHRRAQARRRLRRPTEFRRRRHHRPGRS